MKLVLFLILIPLLLLQVFLAKKKKAYMGLILPLLLLVLSLVLSFVFINRTGENKDPNELLYDSEGRLIESFEKVDGPGQANEYSTETKTNKISFILIIFLPVIILFAIYGLARLKLRAKDQVKKMTIQDLY